MEEVGRVGGVWRKLEELEECRGSWKSWGSVEEVGRVGGVWRKLEELGESGGSWKSWGSV